MPFQIVRNDITKVKADVIVNTANPEPVIGDGTDHAVYEAAGAAELLKDRIRIGKMKPGQVAWTRAYALDAKYIFHAVGPVWCGGDQQEENVLRDCYAHALALADELGCESIAFPLISSGTYGFPRERALSVALEEVGKFLLSHELLVILVVFDRESFGVSSSLFHDMQEFIDEHHVARLLEKEYRVLDERRQILARRSRVEGMGFQEGSRLFKNHAVPKVEKTLEQILGGQEDTFQQRLLLLIDQKALTDAEVYKKANIDRRVFSKIRCNVNYTPKKKTALAFAIALELDLATTVDLLSRAGYALSPSSAFDQIVAYYIIHGNYDIYEINASLFAYHQPILGE